jgi:lipid-binding SYLF domain-containing protein
MPRAVRIRLSLAAAAMVIAVCVTDRLTSATQAPGRRVDSDANRLAAATAVVSDITSAAKSIPRAVLDKAEGVAVFPEMERVPERRGVGPNTRRSARLTAVDGRGVLSVRGEGGTWSPPASVTIKGDSVPDTGDLVLIIVNRRALETVMRPDFTIGPNTAIAPGPTSADVQTWTEAQRRAEIFGYARTAGVLDGMALTDGQVQPDMIANQRFYGKSLTTTAAVAQTSGPDAIAPWRETLQKKISQK